MKSLSHVRLLATPWTAAYRAPLSMGFSRQEYWSGVPLPSLTHIYYLALYRKSPNSCSSLYQNIYFPEQYALVQETQVGRKTENKRRGLPCCSSGWESVLQRRRQGLIPRSGRSPGGGHGNPLQYSCLENTHGQKSQQATVHRVTKSWTQLSDFTFTFHFHALVKEIATHPSILAWRIPGMGEPGGLPSMGLHRVGHD